MPRMKLGLHDVLASVFVLGVVMLAVAAFGYPLELTILGGLLALIVYNVVFIGIVGYMYRTGALIAPVREDELLLETTKDTL